MQSLVAYPIATISAVAFYALVLALLLPVSRARLLPLLGHPVPPHQTYQLGFDALRGLAAAYVALAHCWYFTYPLFDSTRNALAPWLPYGIKAVAIFCALSGFLIYRAVLSINSIEGLRAYVARRAFRIYPVYLVSVVLGVAFGQYVGQRSALSFALADAFMFRVIEFPAFANPVTWSLYTELLFYAVLPVLVLAIGRSRVLPVALLLFVVMVLAYHPSRYFGIWKYFVVGIIASELAARIKSARVGTPIAIAGAVVLAFDLHGPRFDWAARLGVMPKDETGFTLGLALGIGAILTALPSLKMAGNALNVAPLRILGAISYSLFLIHPFYLLANFPQIGIIASANQFPAGQDANMPIWYLPLVFFPGILAWSVVTFLCIERPGIKVGAKVAARMSRSASSGLRPA